MQDWTIVAPSRNPSVGDCFFSNPRGHHDSAERLSVETPFAGVSVSENPMSDPYDLQRFVDAQNPVYGKVCAELRDGRKKTHWMWFIFPQIEGLGSSPVARKFALSSLAEAAAYLEHPILGPRLVECTGLVNLAEGRPIEQVFGYPDDLKLRSSMTLFAHATPENGVFIDALKKYFSGQFDPATLARLQALQSS
jgi:uncharacterized protein (DUF1810 family)